MEKFKKSIIVSVMITTVLSMSMLAVPVSVGATASAGDLIKMDGLSSVYYLGADSKRYVFPNEQTYFSWYSDFSGVVTVPQSELESYSLGANVTIRPGTKLVKITTDPKVYAVESDGTLLHVPSEATAIALYGSSWAQRVIDVPDAFFTNYTVSSETVSATAYPEGSLIKTADSSTVYYVDVSGNARQISTGVAFEANRFSWDNVITTTLAIPTAGTALAAAESTLIDTSSGAGRTGLAGTGLTVSLAGTTAASATIIATQAIANMASFNFTASSDGDVKITTIKVKRTGVSDDTTLSNSYLYDGITRLTDNASVSSTYITWNNSAGIVTISAGTTKTVTIKSDIKTGTSGQTVGVSLQAASDITTDGATVSGSFPASGNLMSIATATNYATVDFNAAAANPTSDGTPSPQDEFELWRDSSVTIGNRAVNLEYITFRQIGSVADDDLANFKLFIDGVQTGDTVAALDSNGYVTFDLTSSPKELKTGNRNIKVLVDLVGGSTRTTSLSLRHAADVVLVDSEYNANVRATVASATFSAVSSEAQTIAAGVLTVTKTTDSPSGNVVNADSAVVLGKFEFKATGESIKVETLRVAVVEGATEADYALRNGAVFADDAQVGSTSAIPSTGDSPAYVDYSLGSSLVIDPGSPVIVEIRADIYDNAGTTNEVGAADTIQIRLVSLANSAQRMTSSGYITAPTATTDGNELTVAEGGLTLAEYTGYADQSAVSPKTPYKLGEWRLTADTTEGVNLTAIEVTWAGTGAVNVPTQLTDAYIVYGDKTTVAKSAVATSTPDSWSINYAMSKGETISIVYYSNVAASTVCGMTPTMTVKGTAVGSSADADSSATGAQTITWTTGTVASAATETPLDQIVYGGQTVTAADYEITATNDTYTVKEIAIKVISGAQAAISEVYLYDGATLLNTGGTPMNGIYATTTGLSLVIPANTTKTLTVKLGLNAVGTGATAPGLNASTTLDTLKVENSNGTAEYVSDDREGNAVYVYKTYPIVSHVVMSAAERKIINGNAQAIYKFEIEPVGGTIGVKQMKFNLAWTDEGPTVADLELGTLKFYRGTTDITAIVDIVDADGTSAKSGGTALGEADTTGGLVVSFKTSEEQISAKQAYSIKATPANFDSGTTSSDQVSITMMGDTGGHNATKKYADNYLGDGVWRLATDNSGTSSTAYNFIWSDRSLVSHNAASGSSSADWFNGYLVDYFDLDSTIMDKNPS